MSPAAFSRLAFALAAALLAGLAPAGAATLHDELIALNAGQMVVAPLPAGPASEPAEVDARGGPIFALPGGRILVAGSTPLTPGGGPPHTSAPTLNELLADGSLRRIATLPGSGPLPAAVWDMDLDSQGRFYVLMYFGFFYGGPWTSLLEIDPETGAILSDRRVPTTIKGIATAPKGLWTLMDGKLRQLDTDTLSLGPEVVDLGGDHSLEADSTGRLYFLRDCSPSCSSIGTWDPAVGGAVATAPAELFAGLAGVSSFTIRRRCYGSSEAICLQGSRFRAEVDYAAFDGASGAGRLAPDRSRDTGVFYFFDPANWELMAKVLDGCAINGHYWVYGAASTDVAYTLTVTDTGTGAVKTYTNRLGIRSPAIADSGAFACDG